MYIQLFYFYLFVLWHLAFLSIIFIATSLRRHFFSLCTFLSPLVSLHSAFFLRVYRYLFPVDIQFSCAFYHHLFYVDIQFPVQPFIATLRHYSVSLSAYRRLCASSLVSFYAFFLSPIVLRHFYFSFASSFILFLSYCTFYAGFISNFLCLYFSLITFRVFFVVSYQQLAIFFLLSRQWFTLVPILPPLSVTHLCFPCSRCYVFNLAFLPSFANYTLTFYT